MMITLLNGVEIGSEVLDLAVQHLDGVVHAQEVGGNCRRRKISFADRSVVRLCGGGAVVRSPRGRRTELSCVSCVR
jgi:hypothetical protein